LGQHEEELVAELNGYIPANARMNAGLVPAEGCDDVAQ
jgi:hypothetical protein